MFWVLFLMLSPLNVYSQEECGVQSPVRQKRVVVGSQAPLGEFPWAGSLIYCLQHEMPSCKTRHDYGFCGGTLINNRQVLTAGHCVRRPLFNYVVNGVIFGAVRINENLLNGLGYGLSQILVHPNYELIPPGPIHNDIAILTLKEVVPFTDFIKPICLPTLPDLVTNNFVGYNPDLAGWGATNDLEHEVFYSKSQVLLYQQVEVLDTVTCQRWYARVDRTTHICAGGSGNSTCHGDSGGALVLYHSGRYYIIGIASYAYDCTGYGNPRGPALFTRITGYIDWITKNRVPPPLFPGK